jgi:hypothetical protein
MDYLDEGDILPNPDEAIEYENKLGLSYAKLRRSWG